MSIKQINFYHKKKFNFLILFILYLSLLLGFYLNEDALGGAEGDYFSSMDSTISFLNNFSETLLNYDDLGHRHSPVFFMFQSFLFGTTFSEFLIRLLNLHIFLLIPIYFYKCLKLRFNKINKKILKYISGIILLLPTFRASSIWPDPFCSGQFFL